MYGYVILSLVLAVVATDLVTVETPPDPFPVLGATAAVLAAVLLAGLTISGYILLCRHRLESQEQRFLRMVGVLGRLYRALVVCANALILFGCGWADLARAYGAVGGWDAGVLVLNVVPICLLLLVAWTALYWADRRLRALMFERAGAPQGGRHWTLPRYLEFMFRQYLLVILVPLVVLLTLNDVVYRLVAAQGMPTVALLVDVVVIVAAVTLAGVWVRVCWRTEALPEGPLRSRLLALAERAGVRVGNVLIWRTNLSIANGCMIGLVGPFRYIMITDALLLSLSADEVEAVFAHETAHVKYRHALLFLVMTVGAIGLSMAAGTVVMGLTGSFTAGTATIGAAVFVYVALGFGFVSRRCEEECDLYAVRATTCPAACSPPDAAGRTVWARHEAAASDPPTPAAQAADPAAGAPLTAPTRDAEAGEEAPASTAVAADPPGDCDASSNGPPGGPGPDTPAGLPSDGPSTEAPDDPQAGSDGLPGGTPMPEPPASSICEHRVRTFATALRRIARLNGTAEVRRGLRHFSIARRCRFLERLVAEPALATRMERRIRRLKVAVVVLALIAIVVAGVVLTAFEESQPDEPENPAGPDDVLPRYDTLIARLVDRNEVYVLALGPPQFHRRADVAADAGDDRVPRARFGRAARHHDVAVADARGHAVAVDAQGERPRIEGSEPRHVDKLGDAVRRRPG